QGQDARVLGGLYFANSIGAAGGALAATFLLLPRLGMPGALVVAGIANLLVAAAAAWLARGEGRAAPVPRGGVPAARPEPVEGPAPALARPDAGMASGDAPAPAAPPATPASPGPPAMLRAVLWAGLLSGACSFVYEIGWIRLLNQALGTTAHSF